MTISFVPSYSIYELMEVKKKLKRILIFFRTPTVREFHKLNYHNFQIQIDLERLKKELPKAIKVVKSDDPLFILGSLAVRWTGDEVAPL